MQTTTQLGSLSRDGVPPRPRGTSRNDDEYLFNSPANAERLLRAIENSRAERGYLTFTIDELRRELGLGEA
jgi:hypothetical protein